MAAYTLHVERGAAVHAVLALRRRQFTTLAAGNVSVKLEHGFLLDHDPSDPRISDGEQEEQSYDGAGAEVQELNAEGEGQEHAGREDVDGPFESHDIRFYYCASI